MSTTPFSELTLHPLVAAAIARRGYDAATPVQAAVRDPALAGRDLLVSAQTGSGKTLAFGSLLADALLADAGPKGGKVGGPPQALVIVPTRELAAQVGRELAWLLEDARLPIGTFTGGTPLGPDIRTLRKGVPIAVGTPGRLIDLLDRQALDLSAIRALVLDEADEMLDLGFREDLEKLLGAAPPERRTLLFSATVPSTIERLAGKFQRNAARLNLRAASGGSAHADITYRAILVRTDDRLAAVVNVLLASEGKAIAFCRTRDRVSALHRRLVDMGMRAEAIAGDRAQGERDRALAALREGSARVLVATDVAARGIDLPDVELVLHADLPDSAESLTHRSGRTGRAGRKGTTILVADLRDRRKAERLLREAGLQASWTAAPDPSDVQRKTEERLFADLVAAARSQPAPAGTRNSGRDDDDQEDGSDDGSHANAPVPTDDLGDRLRAALPERVLLAVLLARELERMPQGLPLVPLDPQGPARRQGDGRMGDDDRAARQRADFVGAAVYRVSVGRETGADPGSLLPLICNRGGITRHDVGAIRIGGGSSTFEISASVAASFERALKQPDPRNPQARFEVLRAATGGARPAGGRPAGGPSRYPSSERRPAGPAGRHGGAGGRADADAPPPRERAAHEAPPQPEERESRPMASATEPPTAVRPRTPAAAAKPSAVHAAAKPSAVHAGAAKSGSKSGPHAGAAKSAVQAAEPRSTPGAYTGAPKGVGTGARPASVARAHRPDRTSTSPSGDEGGGHRAPKRGAAKTRAVPIREHKISRSGPPRGRHRP